MSRGEYYYVHLLALLNIIYNIARNVRSFWTCVLFAFGNKVSAKGKLVVSGLQLGNVWITVQPLLGVEGDPMRLLFERDLTPHPQYCAAYEWM